MCLCVHVRRGEGESLNNRISNYINKFCLFTSSQFGFRTGCPANIAITTFVDKVRNHFDSKKVAAGLSVDFGKAFDTINYKII